MLRSNIRKPILNFVEGSAIQIGTLPLNVLARPSSVITAKTRKSRVSNRRERTGMKQKIFAPATFCVMLFATYASALAQQSTPPVHLGGLLATTAASERSR